MKFIFTALIWVCWPFSAVWAWDFAVHFVIAQRAYDLLPEGQQAEVQRLSALLAEAEPAVSDFVPASAWLDAQNWSGFGLMRNWHYQPQPWLQGPYALPDTASDHAIWVLEQALQTLAKPETTDFQKALMLRVLVHVSADLHQPLHAIERFSPAHPAGDRGGSAFAIEHPDYRHLHALWDAAGGQYPYLRLEDWPAARPRIQAWADQLGAAYPCGAETNIKPAHWAAEAYSVAIQAYAGIRPGSSPSAAYLSQTRALSQRQMGLAACRLAEQLRSLL